MHTSSKFWLYILILKLPRKSKSINSWLEHWGLLEVPDGGLVYKLTIVWTCSDTLLGSSLMLLLHLYQDKIRFIVRLESEKLRNIKAMSGSTCGVVSKAKNIYLSATTEPIFCTKDMSHLRKGYWLEGLIYMNKCTTLKQRVHCHPPIWRC